MTDFYATCIENVGDLFTDEVYRKFEASIANFDTRRGEVKTVDEELAMYDEVIKRAIDMKRITIAINNLAKLNRD